MLELVKGFIEAMLWEDTRAPKKQRHTMDRIVRRLAAEHGFEEVSYSTVRDWVRRRRPEIEREARERRRFLAQHPA